MYFLYQIFPFSGKLTVFAFAISFSGEDNDFFLFILWEFGTGATWCVCKDGPDTVLQKTLDYACGAGADCNPIHTNGPCYNPNSVKAHCSYAVNSYFQNKKEAQGTCDFAGAATISASDPSKTPSYPSEISTFYSFTN